MIKTKSQADAYNEHEQNKIKWKRLAWHDDAHQNIIQDVNQRHILTLFYSQFSICHRHCLPVCRSLFISVYVTISWAKRNVQHLLLADKGAKNKKKKIRDKICRSFSYCRGGTNRDQKHAICFLLFSKCLWKWITQLTPLAIVKRYAKSSEVQNNTRLKKSNEMWKQRIAKEKKKKNCELMLIKFPLKFDKRKINRFVWRNFNLRYDVETIAN